MRVQLEVSNAEGNFKTLLSYHIFPSPDDPNVVDLYLHDGSGNVVASTKDTDLSSPGNCDGAFGIRIPPGNTSERFTLGVVNSKTQSVVYKSQPFRLGDLTSATSSLSTPSPTNSPPPILDSPGGTPPPPPPPSTTHLNLGTPIIYISSSPTTAATQESNPRVRATNLGVPVGIGLLVLVIVLGIVSIFIYRKRRQRQAQSDTLPRSHKYKRTHSPTSQPPLVAHSNLRAFNSTTSLVPPSASSTLFEPEKGVMDYKQFQRTTAEFEKHRRRNTLFSGSSLFNGDDEDDLEIESKSDEFKSNEKVERFRQSRPPPYASILGPLAQDPFSDEFKLASSYRESSTAVDGD